MHEFHSTDAERASHDLAGSDSVDTARTKRVASALQEITGICVKVLPVGGFASGDTFVWPLAATALRLPISLTAF